MEIFKYFNIDRSRFVDRISKLHESYDEYIGMIQLTRGHRHLSREFEYAKEMMTKIEEQLRIISIECFGNIDKRGLPIIDIPEENCKYFYTTSSENKEKEVTKNFYYKELIPRELHNYLFFGGDNHNPHKLNINGYT
tara:strand:- start:403 stop:813 length:411 start_codon:yes stop_codon:yes gene_type:complete